MPYQTIYLKGMVCNRCLMIVESELKTLGHTPVKISLGQISYVSPVSSDERKLLEKLSSLGFDLLENKKVRLTGEVKEVIESVYGGDFDFPEKFRLTSHLKQLFPNDYHFLSDAFISTEKKTIEQYMIEYRIQKVKEYLVYSSLTLSDIAFKLNFNSVAHLSAHFKQQTGLTPSFFKGVEREKAGYVFSQN